MSTKIVTLASSIAALAIPGVNVKDLDEIPEEVNTRICPILFPSPDGFVSGLSLSRESYGADSVAAKNVSYTLNYVYLHAPIGSYRYIAQAQAEMVDNVEAIVDKLADNSTLTGAVDITPRVEGEMGVQQDPAGNSFAGCMIAIDVLDYYEVS